MTRDDKIELLKLLEEREKRKAKSNLLKFIEFTRPKYDAQWFHKMVCEKLDSFDRGEIKKLMIWIPPQHGKSEISTRRYPAYTLGRNPNQKLAVVSYNHTFASKFNRDIQRVIDDPVYHSIFPDTCLNQSNARAVTGSYLRNNDEFEIVNSSGSVVSVGVGGGLTGRQIDKLIIDDIYKDAKDAWSPLIQENVWQWYTTVADTRLHNESQQLIVFTRWHENDLAGKLIKHEPDEWEVIKLPAIREDEPNNYDPRQIGEPLWGEKHSLEKLLKSKKKSEVAFSNLFQQNPKPLKGLLYSTFKTYTQLPHDDRAERVAYTDTADTGNDFLCMICAVKIGVNMYVIDVLYTQESAETSEPMMAEILDKNNIDSALFESNNGGRAIARNVERLSLSLGNNRTTINWFHQSKNKIARIHSNASTVMNTIYFPEFWHSDYSQFHADLTSYSKMGKNKHDDAPDAITGLIEENSESDFTFV